MVKFSWLRLPLGAPLHRDDPEAEALLPDHSLLLRMVSIHGSVMNSGELLRWIARNRGDERGIERVQGL
jgi:hypothetical protein